MREAIATTPGTGDEVAQVASAEMQPFETVDASNDSVSTNGDDTPHGLQSLGYAPEIEAPHGFADAPPVDVESAAPTPPVLTEVVSSPTVDINLDLAPKLDIDLSETPKSGLTQDAEDLITSAASGAPGFISNNFKRILSENGVVYRADMTPEDALRELQSKRDVSQPQTVVPEVAASTEVDPMQAFVDGLKMENNLGDKMNRPAINDGGYQLNTETPPVSAESTAEAAFDKQWATAGLKLVPKEGESTSPTKAPEAIRAKELSPDIAATYQERFGITKEALESIEGFGDLSPGQQKMALENLSQLTIGRIREEAIDGHTADIADEKSKKNFLGKVWVGIRDSVMKKADTVKREKMLAKDMQKGGITVHKDTLQQLVSGMKNFGPEVIEKNGELEVQLIETKGLSPEVAKVAEVFNEQGNAFSKIPYEWSLDTATADQKKAFGTAKETYELQRGVLMQHMETAEGKEKAFAAMAKTESTIEMQRFMQTCPDAAKELEKIENQNVWTAALASVGTERGIYMAGGYAARAALGAAIGLAAAPIVAAVMGGAMGYKRAKEGLVQQDKDQRAGKELPDTKAQQAAKARIAVLNSDIASMVDGRVKEDRVAELDQLNKSLQGTAKNMVESVRGAEDKDAEGYRGSVEKLDGLITKIRGEEDSSRDPGKLVAMLERRIEYTEQKMRDGKMVFGDKKERLANQYALTNSLMQAKALIAGMTAVDAQGLKTEERLAKMLGEKDKDIKSSRKWHLIRKVALAGTIGAGFAGVGAAARDWMSDDSVIAETWAGATGAEVLVANVDGSPAIAGAEWVETLGGLSVAPEDVDAVQPSGTGLIEPGASMSGAPAPFEENFAGSAPLSSEAVPGYTVKGGDNLSNIFAREIPGSTNQQVMRELLKMSPDELKALGVKSGNMNLIHPGDTIDVEKMRTLLAAQSTPSGAASIAEPVRGSQGLAQGHGAPSLYPESQIIEKVVTGTETIVLPDDEALAKVILDESQGTFVEGAPLVPERTLSEVGALEIKNWPHNKPLPWPVDDEEANHVFGVAISPERRFAENMRAVIGRYPNKDEFVAFSGVEKIDTVEARSLLLDMKKSPMTYNQIKEAVEPVVLRYEHEMGQAPLAPMSTEPRAELLQTFAPTLESSVAGNADFDPNGLDKVVTTNQANPHLQEVGASVDLIPKKV